MTGANAAAAASSGQSQQPEKYSVLMVCSGNICRSPMAEAVFQHMVKQRDLADKFDRIESAGTHSFIMKNSLAVLRKGELTRTLAVLQKNKIPWDSVAQKVKESDFHDFTHILGMDTGHVSYLNRMKPKKSRAEVALFGSYGDGNEIDDPYYGGRRGFDDAYKQVTAYSTGLLEALGFKQ